MFKSLDIQKDMEVVGLDGKHVGTVDHLEAADRIILSKDDPKAGGRHHLISIDWVGLGIDELDVDTHAAAAALHRAFEHIMHGKPCARCANLRT